MFAQSIHLECVSFFEPTEGVWREENVNGPTDDETRTGQTDEEEDFLSFCRRSLL
ncbi:hypothetical protein DVDV_1401 [Desulfovibrio sp. DV]|uniref:hypothetical protein n=1 Tax=Desulfovibrio sp. DV TaxID=1844708 RepID=UPI00096854D0|nr:hypothetical protein [Desulfovibrio sp. DV]OLN28836.1 hypothetical protein DVDV_1401 [Desulfovibrio sp. DV]